jgi:hypothetical protein
MLDLRILRDMPPGTYFATGEAMDSQDSLFLANTGQQLRWVAVRGHGPLDWAIYAHFSDRDIYWIAKQGDKVQGVKYIQLCVPCDNEALEQYRR